MKPTVDHTEFGCITIDGQHFDHDVIIRLDGTIEKRNKKLSKKIFGNSHRLSKDEAEYIFQDGAELVIIGTGQYGELRLSDEAKAFFEECRCRVEAMNTKKAVVFYNHVSDENTIAMFHVTC